MDRSAPSSPSLPAALADSGEGSVPEVYGLEELLAAAGEHLGEEISPRTVRLYATQGLLDRPGREGRSAVYGRRHLLQLLLIRSLARRGLSLAAIAPLLGLDDQALEQRLSQLEGEGPIPAVASGAWAGNAPSDPGSPESGVSERDQALDYLRSLQPTVAASPAAGATGLSSPDAGASDDDSAERTASLMSMLGSPLSSRTPSRSPGARSPSSRSPSRSGGSREAASRWHRFTLAPGVELQISEAVSVPPPGSRRMAWLNRLVARLIEQLEDSPP